MRVHPHCGPHAFIGPSHGDALDRCGEITSDSDASFDTDGSRRGEKFLNRRRRLVRAVEMTVIVDPAQ